MSRLELSAIAMALLIATQPLAAQSYPFSQRGSVVQNVAFTEITVVYGRPVARGRKLFGADSALVPYDKIWHPGADSATRITFSRDVELEGKRLAAGTYSLWLIPRASGTWTLIFSKAAHVFHQPYPGEQHDALRLDVPAARGQHMESMSIYFPRVLRDEAELRLHWGEIFAPLRIRAPTVAGSRP